MLHHLQLIYFITGDFLPFTNFILPLVPFPLARKNRILCIYESVFIFPLCILLEDNCFTRLCGPLPYINMNQPQVYICPLLPESPSYLPHYPTPLILSQSSGLSSHCHTENSHLLSVIHMVMYIFPC